MCPSNQVEMPADSFFATLDAMEWSGSPCPLDPDNFWIDDETGERVCAETGTRTPPLTTFRVLLNFRKGPDMSTEVDAADEVQAVAKARKWASQCGFVGAEKRKPTVYAVQA